MSGSKGFPDMLVFASRFLFCRMRCSMDACGGAEVVRRDRHGAVGLDRGRAHVRPQACDSRPFLVVSSAIGQLRTRPLIRFW